MSISKPDKDIELAKINVASQYRTSYFVTLVAAYLAADLTLLVVWFDANTVHVGWIFDGGIAFISFLIGLPLYLIVYRPFTRYMRCLSDAIKQIEGGQPIGDLNEVIKGNKR